MKLDEHSSREILSLRMNWFWQGFWGVPNFGRLSLFQWLRLTVVTTVCSVKVLKVCPWSMMANGCGPWTYIFNMISIFKTSSRNIYSIYYIYPPNKNERAMAISQNGWQHVDNAYCLFSKAQGLLIGELRSASIWNLDRWQQICLDFAHFWIP